MKKSNEMMDKAQKKIKENEEIFRRHETAYRHCAGHAQ